MTIPEQDPTPQPPAAPYASPQAQAHQPAPPADKKAKKPLLKRWWFWVLVAIVAIVAINAVNGGADNNDAGNAGGDKSVTDTAEGEAADEKPAEEKPAENKLPGIGEVVVAGDMEITVTTLESGLASIGNEYLNEAAQGAFTLVGVTVTNTGKSSESVFSSSFTVRDAEDREFDANATASLYLEQSGFIFEEINPGNSLSGILVFDLPADVAPVALDFTPGLFGKSVTIALQ